MPYPSGPTYPRPHNWRMEIIAGTEDEAPDETANLLQTITLQNLKAYTAYTVADTEACRRRWYHCNWRWGSRS